MLQKKKVNPSLRSVLCVHEAMEAQYEAVLPHFKKTANAGIHMPATARNRNPIFFAGRLLGLLLRMVPISFRLPAILQQISSISALLSSALHGVTFPVNRSFPALPHCFLPRPWGWFMSCRNWNILVLWLWPCFAV